MIQHVCVSERSRTSEWTSPHPSLWRLRGNQPLSYQAVNAYLGIIPAFNDRKFAHLAGQLAADETEHFTLLSNALGQPLPAAFSFGA